MLPGRRNFIKTAAAGLAVSAFFRRNVFAGDYSASKKYYFTKPSDDEEWWKFLKSHFSLDSRIHYFNNGSLGPSPEYVLDKTEEFRRTLDSFPSKYMWGGWDENKEQVRSSVADYFSANSEEIAIIHNTSEGMNLFARSLGLKAGDEIIIADHEHRTGVLPYEYYSKPKGIKLVRPVLPLIPRSPEEITDIYRKAISVKTRLISLVHMTNTNGMILPVKEISAMAKEKGILVCVDGAQAAGMIKFDIKDLGCDFYAASGHKWLFGPKGTGILYAAEKNMDLLKPLMISNKWSKNNIRMFEDYNTRNLPEVLGLGAAIDFNNMIGQQRKESRILALKKYFRNYLEGDDRFIIKTPAPDKLSAGIQAVEITGKNASDAREFLMRNFNIDCRPLFSHGLNALRISLSVFNTKEDIDLLVTALKKNASS